MMSKICLILALQWTVVFTTSGPNVFTLTKEMQSHLNEQISAEYDAFYVYENMASYFSRPSVGLAGFGKFFRKAADEEVEHARKFTEFVNRRGGVVTLKHIMPTPESTPQSFTSVKQAIALAIDKEIEVGRKIHTMHMVAGENKDSEAQNFLDPFLTEQVESISKLRSMAARMELCDSAIFLMDQELR